MNRREPTTDWQRRRGAFNHDWLKNQYLPALATMANVATGEIEAEDALRPLRERHLPRWPAASAEARALIGDFEEQMSPAVYLDRPPLCDSDMDAETRQWLRRVTHERWLRRHPVQRWVDDVQSAISSADEAHERLSTALAALGEPTSQADVVRLGAPIAAFYEACYGLARAIEKLPSEILLT